MPLTSPPAAASLAVTYVPVSVEEHETGGLAHSTARTSERSLDRYTDYAGFLVTVLVRGALVMTS